MENRIRESLENKVSTTEKKNSRTRKVTKVTHRIYADSEIDNIIEGMKSMYCLDNIPKTKINDYIDKYLDTVVPLEAYESIMFDMVRQAMKDYINGSDKRKEKILADLKSEKLVSITKGYSALAAEALENRPEEVAKNLKIDIEEE